MHKVFYIPKKVDYVFVSDMFAADYSGGAELTLEALIQSAPAKTFKLHSSSLTDELVKKNKDKYWIIGNYTSADKNAIAELVRSEVRYTIIECDYKYCIYRSSHLHNLKEGTPCDCHTSRHGRFTRALFAKADWVMFMSKGQMEEYVKLFPGMPYDNFIVQSSTFSNDTLEYIASLRKNRKNIKEKWAILKGGSWIKAEQETIKWANENTYAYELLGGMAHKEFLKKLSEYKGLIFMPAGYDTCPRLVCEAKLLGLELVLNDNVQHKDEKWFKSSIEECEAYLKNRTNQFWQTVLQSNNIG